MNYIDIHCHLDFPDYDSDREEVLGRMREKKVGAITIGTNLESSRKAIEIAEQNENVWACIGVHPGDWRDEKIQNSVFGEKKFVELAKSPKVVGVGECGLDYFRLENERQKEFQKKLFEKQIQFALIHNKPLMLHIRDAYDDALEILKNYKEEAEEKLRGNIHFFAGDISIAQKFLDLEFTMSFTGVVTFTHNYDEVIKYIPRDSIMSETDAPFLAPVPCRGERNEPSYIVEIVEKLAEIRGESTEVLNDSIIKNFRRIFSIQNKEI